MRDYILVKKSWIDGLLKEAENVDKTQGLDNKMAFVGLLGYARSAKILEASQPATLIDAPMEEYCQHCWCATCGPRHSVEKIELPPKFKIGLAWNPTITDYEITEIKSVVNAIIRYLAESK